MKARDVMVSPVITVNQESTIRELAETLLAHRISAVPVLDASGSMVGIISEADLLHRSESGTERPSSWWLSLISGERALAADYVQSHALRVGDVMATEVQTAHPDTPLVEIADLLEEKHIKRIPIIDDHGALVGIVSRANIVQAIASARPALETSLSDAAIREKLIAELRKRSWAHIHKLNATVTNGIVDLWGFAGSEKERQAIRVAAESIPGVVAINDHLLREPACIY